MYDSNYDTKHRTNLLLYSDNMRDKRAGYWFEADVLKRTWLNYSHENTHKITRYYPPIPRGEKVVHNRAPGGLAPFRDEERYGEDIVLIGDSETGEVLFIDNHDAIDAIDSVKSLDDHMPIYNAQTNMSAMLSGITTGLAIEIASTDARFSVGASMLAVGAMTMAVRSRHAKSQQESAAQVANSAREYALRLNPEIKILGTREPSNLDFVRQLLKKSNTPSALWSVIKPDVGELADIEQRLQISEDDRLLLEFRTREIRATILNLADVIQISA